MATKFPEAFKNQMQQLLGEEYSQFEQAYELPVVPISIRYNPAKITQRPINAVSWSRYGEYLAERPIFTLDPLFHAGTYYVQEASSMFVEQAIVQHFKETKDKNILDLCAAPGGKTTHLLSLIDSSSLVVANEVIKTRLHILKENIQKWGAANVVLTQSDPERFSSLNDFFDLIIVDAPCSGEGLFRRDDEAMQEWSLEHVQHCAMRQKRILDDIWPALKPGGILVYSTCTFNREEDENMIDWCIQELGAECLFVTCEKEWGVTESITAQGAVGYKFYPHKVNGEGFFISVMKKKGEKTIFHKSKKYKSPFAEVPKELGEKIKNWFVNAEEYITALYGEQILLLPKEKINDVLILAHHLHLISCGLEVGESKKKNVVPSAALALSTIINKEKFATKELDKKEALQFLAKEYFEMDLPEDDWILICYQETPLGWVKKINQRYNNYYPIEWRIRMNLPF